jgi:hypothetical protein
MWTTTVIKDKLSTNDLWLIKGILAIYQRQTYDEQDNELTKEKNGVGFNSCDAGILTSFAKQIKKNKTDSKYTLPLSPKQLKVARKKMLKYAGQLTEIANRNNPDGGVDFSDGTSVTKTFETTVSVSTVGAVGIPSIKVAPIDVVEKSNTVIQGELDFFN